MRGRLSTRCHRENQERIINALSGAPQTAAEIAKAARLTTDFVAKELQRLIACHLVDARFVRDQRAFSYALADPTPKEPLFPCRVYARNGFNIGGRRL